MLEASKKTELILRTPRFEDARPDREVAALECVQDRTDIPVATVVAKDFTSNVLGKPLVIQNRISDKDLQIAWDYLSHEQRCDWDSAVFAPKFVVCAPPHWL